MNYSSHNLITISYEYASIVQALLRISFVYMVIPEERRSQNPQLQFTVLS